ncbi:NADH-quinone oxidoreductase subunit L, partial [Streptomyces sp. NPDC058953]
PTLFLWAGFCLKETGLNNYAAWRSRAPRAAALPAEATAAARAAHPDAPPSTVEAEAIAAHTPAYGSIASAPDPADPGRILLGPLHRHAASGFHLDAVAHVLFVRPVAAAARLVHFLDREVVETYVRGAALGVNGLGRLVRRAQTGNVQTYVGWLLAGTAVLVIAAVVLSTVNAGS